MPPGLSRVYIALIIFSGVGIEQRHIIYKVVNKMPLKSSLSKQTKRCKGEVRG